MPPVPQTPLMRLSALTLSLVVLTGCPASAAWDHEYLCQGLERSTTHLQAHPETEVYEKNYPIAIDFHVRSGSALVKSHQVALQGPSEGVWAFHSKSPSSWASGSFNDQSGTLSLIENRVLFVDGVAQETRTTGQYACKGTGLSKTL